MGLQDRKNSGDFLNGVVPFHLEESGFSIESDWSVRLKKKGLGNAVFLSLFLFPMLLTFGCQSGSGESAGSGVDTPKVVVTPETPLVTPAQIRKLRQTLLNQQILQKRDLKRAQDLAVKKLGTEQRTAYKEWSNAEKTARKKFFADHEDGKSRREYVKDFLHRREELVQAQRFELQTLRKKQDEEMKDLELAFRGKRRESEAYFKEKRKPSFLPL
jgi:hypothetical protein